MTNAYKHTLITSGLVLILSIYAYIDFASYRPKALAQVESIHSYNTEEFSIVYPKQYTELGINKIQNGKQITLKTTESPQDVQNFYKNIYSIKGWKLESETQVSNFLITKYKQDNRSVLISTTKAEMDTIVGIELKIED